MIVAVVGSEVYLSYPLFGAVRLLELIAMDVWKRP